MGICSMRCILNWMRSASVVTRQDYNCGTSDSIGSGKSGSADHAPSVSRGVWKYSIPSTLRQEKEFSDFKGKSHNYLPSGLLTPTCAPPPIFTGRGLLFQYRSVKWLDLVSVIWYLYGVGGNHNDTDFINANHHRRTKKDRPFDDCRIHGTTLTQTQRFL